MTPHNKDLPSPSSSAPRAGYAAPNILLKVEVTRMNMLANTFMRAPGEAVGTLRLESAIDELAEELGIDPVELRLRNEPDRDPTSGLPFSSRHISQAWRDGAERFGWHARPSRGTRREGEWRIGVGCATGTYPYYRMPGAEARLPDPRRRRRDGASRGRGRGNGDGHVHHHGDRRCGAAGLAVDRVDVGYGDSAIPGAIIAGGSQQTAAIGAAVIAAHTALVGDLLKLAATTPRSRACRQTRSAATTAGSPASPIRPGARATPQSSRGRSVTRSPRPRRPRSRWKRCTGRCASHSALFCEVRVNAVTGETRVSRFLGSFDCGRILQSRSSRTSVSSVAASSWGWEWR
ncbi:molybdopterin cofactor-binding domain-containing protein [Sphingomonas sp. MMS24-JH45]